MQFCKLYAKNKVNWFSRVQSYLFEAKNRRKKYPFVSCIEIILFTFNASWKVSENHSDKSFCVWDWDVPNYSVIFFVEKLLNLK